MLYMGIKSVVYKIAVILFLTATLFGCFEEDPDDDDPPELPPVHLDTPSNLRVEYSPGTATLRWNTVSAPTGVCMYKIYKSDNAEGPYTEITFTDGSDYYNSESATSGISGSTYSIRGLPLHTPYITRYLPLLITPLAKIFRLDRKANYPIIL